MEGSITRDSVVENPEHSGDNGERNLIILHGRPPATEGGADDSKRVEHRLAMSRSAEIDGGRAVRRNQLHESSDAVRAGHPVARIAAASKIGLGRVNIAVGGNKGVTPRMGHGNTETEGDEAEFADT